MHSSQLRPLVDAFAGQAATVLATAVAGGDEVGFELVAERGRGRGTPLYCYRPLTEDFVDRHAAALAQLDAYLPALHALASTEGLPAYLQARGIGQPPAGARQCAELALRLLLAQVYEGADPDFEYSVERFERAFSTLQRAALDGQSETIIVALLRGLVVRSPEVALADGLTLMQPEAFDLLPPQSGWPAVADGPVPATLAVLAGGGELGAAAQRLRALLRAMRLFSAGVALEPVAWTRADACAWRPIPLDVRGEAHGAIVISPEQEDELRAFCSLIARRASRQSTLGWALHRFELGCEASDPLIALTDHLLALRALLEPEGPRSGRLAGRLAALCALPPDRPALAERVAHAISLEHSAIAGLAPLDRDVARLVGELADDLRALLRDVLCGHLGSDLVAMADELIAAGAGGDALAAPGVEAVGRSSPDDPAGDAALAAADVGGVESGDGGPPSDDFDLETLAGDWPAADQLGGQLFA